MEPSASRGQLRSSDDGRQILAAHVQRHGPTGPAGDAVPGTGRPAAVRPPNRTGVPVEPAG